MHYEVFCELWVSLVKEIETFPYPKVNINFKPLVFMPSRIVILRVSCSNISIK